MVASSFLMDCSSKQDMGRKKTKWSLENVERRLWKNIYTIANSRNKRKLSKQMLNWFFFGNGVRTAGSTWIKSLYISLVMFTREVFIFEWNDYTLFVARVYLLRASVDWFLFKVFHLRVASVRRTRVFLWHLGKSAIVGL